MSDHLRWRRRSSSLWTMSTAQNSRSSSRSCRKLLQWLALARAFTTPAPAFSSRFPRRRCAHSKRTHARTHAPPPARLACRRGTDPDGAKTAVGLSSHGCTDGWTCERCGLQNSAVLLLGARTPDVARAGDGEGQQWKTERIDRVCVCIKTTRPSWQSDWAAFLRWLRAVAIVVRRGGTLTLMFRCSFVCFFLGGGGCVVRARGGGGFVSRRCRQTFSGRCQRGPRTRPLTQRRTSLFSSRHGHTYILSTSSSCALLSRVRPRPRCRASISTPT